MLNVITKPGTPKADESITVSEKDFITALEQELLNDQNPVTLEDQGGKGYLFTLRSPIYEKYKASDKRHLLQQVLKLNDNLSCLFGDAFINDEPIHLFLKNTFSSTENVLVVDSFEITDSPRSVYKRLLHSELSTKTRESKAVSMKKADFVLFPINDNLHWYMVVVRKNSENNYSIFCLDGLNQLSEHQKYFGKVSNYLNALLPNCVIETNSFIVPKQTNGRTCGADCGAVICYWAKQIVQNTTLLDSLNFFKKTRCNYLPFRYNIAHLIALAFAKETQKKLSSQCRPKANAKTIKCPAQQEPRAISQPARWCFYLIASVIVWLCCLLAGASIPTSILTILVISWGIVIGASILIDRWGNSGNTPILSTDTSKIFAGGTVLTPSIKPAIPLVEAAKQGSSSSVKATNTPQSCSNNEIKQLKNRHVAF